MNRQSDNKNGESMTDPLCAEHRHLCAERFARDKQDIEELKQLTRKVSECSIKLSEIAKQQTEKIRDHETRLDELERRPGSLWDKVISGIIAAAVAFGMAAIQHT